MNPLTESQLSDLVVEIEVIAKKAGGIIMNHYGKDIPVDHKSDDSPVTQADREADEMIRMALLDRLPEIPVISEEAPIPPYEVRRDWNEFWLVDPLDGTKEFIKQNGEFTVNIALVRSGVPVLGVIYLPAKGVMYSAVEGRGAFRQPDGGAKEPIASVPAVRENPIRVVMSRSHSDAKTLEYLDGLEISEKVSAGSSLKFCRVAEGAADLYPRFVPTMEWDVAAGDCIFRCSGKGKPRRSPLTYNKPTLKNDSFVIGW